MTDTPRIYVASLSDYNAGILHGEWIDATQGVEGMWEEINAMLAASPEFKRFPMGGPAEEWAIHDYDNFMGLRLGEYEPKVAAIGEALDDASDPEALAAWLGIADTHYDSIEDQLRGFDEHFRGHWDSFKSYVQEDEIGDLFLGISALSQGNPYGTEREKQSHKDIVERLSGYIDWDQVARDLQADYTVVEAGSPRWGVFIFEDNV